MEEIKVYTIEEVAQILKVTRRTVYGYLKTGDLKAAKIGKYWKVTPENIKAFLDKHTK